MPMAPVQLLRTSRAAPSLPTSRSREAGASSPINHHFDLALGHFIPAEQIALCRPRIKAGVIKAGPLTAARVRGGKGDPSRAETPI